MIPKNIEIRIELTTKCNYDCIMCPNSTMKRKKEMMDNELFYSILDKIMKESSQFKLLTFSGMGEPLLDKNIHNKIQYAIKKYNLRIGLLTNGSSLLNVNKFMQLEKECVEYIRISFHNMNPQSYAKITNSKLSQYDISKNNLTEICKIKKHTKILLTFDVIDKINEDDINIFIDYWKDKVDVIDIWKPHNWGTEKSLRKIQEEKLDSCQRPFSGPLQVQCDGTINMSCFDYDGQLLLGDLKTQSLQEIFNSTEFQHIYTCHKLGNFKNSNLICENCDQRNIDNTNVLVYSSNIKKEDRVNKFSTSYKDIFSKLKLTNRKKH